jgi:hypothetical protein
VRVLKSSKKMHINNQSPMLNFYLNSSRSHFTAFCSHYDKLTQYDRDCKNEINCILSHIEVWFLLLLALKVCTLNVLCFPLHMSLGICKLKQQWDITIHLLAWQNSHTLTILSAVNDMEQQDLSFIAGRNNNGQLLRKTVWQFHTN